MPLSDSRSTPAFLAFALSACLASERLSAGDWLQFGGDPRHSGNASAETTLGRENVGRLKRLFHASLPDGSDGAPAYLSGVTTAKGKRDLLFVTLAGGGVSALDARTGEVVWTNRPPAGRPGFTMSCPAVDPGRLYVYGWALDGSVHRYRVGDGVEASGDGWPALVSLKPELEKCSSCLAIATARSGRSYLYAATSSFGDAGDYQGHVTAIDLASGAQRVFNAVCSEIGTHLDASGAAPTGCATAGMGVWARSGVVYDADADRILLTTSNGDFHPAPPSRSWGDSVLALAPDGSGNGAMPLDSYTPAEYDQLGGQDIDLGSTTLAILPPPP
ncbi:MAG TPA: PQQ-binding-like beta-propeller repeat protein, partial [Thermoanaerobaculia bacterium]|nr:PQQ-binding-like beta-propeller repeat protein [Thermoanaerobaculia bacterium]